MLQVDMPDQIYSGSFNSDGSRFVCTCKDKLLRIMDTHTGKTISVWLIHLFNHCSVICISLVDSCNGFVFIFLILCFLINNLFKKSAYKPLQQEGKCHLGSKPAQCAYLKNGQIFTTGFSKMSERQYALWDEVSLFITLSFALKS